MSQPVILHLETSTNVCSVALSEGKNCLFTKENAEGMNHAALLSPFINEALKLLKTQHKVLNAVSVSSGPGSYTGLRIGVSTAKGLCYGLDIPLIAVNTLEILTVPVIKHRKDPDALYCPMIDARRMEVYDAFYKADGSIYREVSADIITADSYQDILKKHTVFFFGNGSDKCRETLTYSNTHFIPDIVPLAENMIELALRKYKEKYFEDTAYFEPFYLKEFQTTTPKKTL